MKKLLALVLVLGLASVASANLSLSYDDSAGTVDIMVDAGGLEGYTLFLDVSDTLTVDGDPAAMADFLWEPVPGYILADNLVDPSAEAGGEGHAYKYSGAAGLGNGANIAAGTAAISGIPVSGVGNLTLTTKINATAIDGAFYNGPAGDGLVDEIFIPEPITMTLLGVGGLLAVRRRR
jgi:hypothetical protein